MSSMFEAPPSPRRSSWLKVGTAFVAGAVVALAISRVPTILYGSAQPVASAHAPAANVRPPINPQANASKPAVAEPAKALAETRENKPPAAEGRDAQAQVATTSAAAGAVEAKTCAWPYADQRCAESDTNSGQATQPVRVIPTDRSTPPPVATTSAPAALPDAKKTGDVAAAGSTSAAPAAPAAVAASPAPSTVPQGAAERVPNEPDNQVREPARSKNAKPKGTAKREARRTKTTDQQSRTVRSRDINERSDDSARGTEFADSTLVHTHVLPDGRRVTVYRQLNARDGARPVTRGDNYPARRVLLPSSDDEDEDD